MVTLPSKVEESLQCADDPRWKSVEEILESTSFARSPRLAQLLGYLASETLLGRGDVITEASIALTVFRRDSSFDPATDTIVRSHMTRLRQKLMQESAAGRAYDVSLPKGGYVVEFREREQVYTAPVASFVEASPTPTEGPVAHSNRLRWLFFAAGLVVAVVLYKTYPGFKARAAARNPLWSQMMAPGENTLFIAADSSLVLMHHYLNHDTSLADYTSGRYLAETVALEKAGDEPNGLSHRHLTSMVDLKLGQFLEKTASSYNSSVQSLYARELNLDELKKSNVILSGSQSANPWLELYTPRMNFVFGKDGVENRTPQAGEPAMYLPERAPDHLCYGVLAFLPGLNASKNVLIVEGTTQAGTEAITDLLFDEERMHDLLSHIPREHGRLSHFEILLDATHMNGNSGAFHVVAQRVYP